MNRLLSFFNELKRRNVFKVGVGYLVVAWLIAQAVHLVFESFGTPEWVIQSTLVLLVAGLPVALFFAWVYELTPDGIKRDKDLPRSQPITPEMLLKLKDYRSFGGTLYSAIYKSRCKGPASWELVESILASSTSNNPANEITGVLVATNTHFLQVLEGDFESINETMERIARDTRHEKVQLIRFGEIEQRRFPDWGMHGIGLFDLNSKLTIELGKRFGEEDGNVRFPSRVDEVMELLDVLLAEPSASAKSN